MTEKRNYIIGTGSALPSKRVSNHDLCQILETSEEWIEERVGIKNRYVCTASESTISLAEKASREALRESGIEPSEIDIVVVGTFTPDQALPSAAAVLSDRLGLTDIVAFDLQAACSGFLFGYITAEALLPKIAGSTALVVGADTLSRVVDWSDRNTAVLFGDGAGACIVRSPSVDAEPSIIASHVKTQAEGASHITCQGALPSEVDAGMATISSSAQPNPYLQMNGRAVFKHGIQLMTNSIEAVLKTSGMSVEDIDLFVPHQSNVRMMSSVCENIGLTDQSKIGMTIDEVGNTSAASIPITLDHYAKKGKLKSGDTVLLTSVGSGMTYGSLLVKW